MSDVILTKHGNNAAITVHLLNDETMRQLGFTDFRDGWWYFERMLCDEISFSISINKNDSTDWHIDVLDEDFGQPYDYQYMLSTSPNAKYANKIKEKVETYMEYLTNHGIITGHKYGDYI